MVEISVEHVLMFVIVILLLLILVKKNNTCQRICNDGFKVGAPVGGPILSSLTTELWGPPPSSPHPPPPPPTPPPPPRRLPLPQTEVECNDYFNLLNKICPEDHVDNMCCNGTNTIYGLNSLSGSCILSLADSSNINMTSQQQIILNNYNTCQDNFPDISAENSIFTVFTDENNAIPPIYLPILQKLEMRSRITEKKTYEIISGSNLKKYNRFMNYVNWSKQNNMNIYTHENDSDGFTVGGQPHPGPVLGTLILAISAGITCTQYFISGEDDDKDNCLLLSKSFAFGCFMCWATAGWFPEEEEALRATRGLTNDQLEGLLRNVDAQSVNQLDLLADLDRPPRIISDDLREQLTQEQIDELEIPTDPTVQLTEEQVQEVSVLEGNEAAEATEAAEGVAQYNIEGQLIGELEEVEVVDEEIALEGGG